MARAQSASVLARQDAAAAARTAATADRLAQLQAVAPNADPADLLYIARWCNTYPSFPTILRVLAAR